MQALIVEQSEYTEDSCHSYKSVQDISIEEVDGEQKACSDGQDCEVELVPAILEVLFRLCDYLDQSLEAKQNEEAAINDAQDLFLLFCDHEIVVSLLNCVNDDGNQDEDDETLVLYHL